MVRDLLTAPEPLTVQTRRRVVFGKSITTSGRTRFASVQYQAGTELWRGIRGGMSIA